MEDNIVSLSKMNIFERTAYEKSRLETVSKLAHSMREEGFSIERIAKIFNIDIENIEEILKERLC